MKYKFPITIISDTALLLAQQQIVIPESTLERAHREADLFEIAPLVAAAQQERRITVVIGNSAYPGENYMIPIDAELQSPPDIGQIPDRMEYAANSLNLDIALMLRRVQSAVKQETGGEQVPWSASSITTEFSFQPTCIFTCTCTSPPPPPVTSPSVQQSPPPRPQQNLISYADLKISFQRTLTGHSDLVNSVAISPDGNTLVSGSGDDTITVWDLATGRVKATLTGHSDWVNSVAISPEGQTLVSGSRENTIKVWDLATVREKATLTGHCNRVNSVAISPDGGTIVSGSTDKTIKVWEANP